MSKIIPIQPINLGKRNNQEYSSAKNKKKKEEEDLSTAERSSKSGVASVSEVGNGVRVYVLGFSGGLVKVGISNNVSRRIRQLETSEKIRHWWQSETFNRSEALLLENLIHSYLRECFEDGVHDHGEYFNMGFREAVKICASMTDSPSTPVYER